MLTAKLGNNTINCYDGTYSTENLKQWAKKGIILCPVCNKPYEYCHGKVNSPYFRHKDKQECLYEYYEPETEEHIRGKILLFEWVKSQDGVYNVVLEGWLPETKQRPDIMFKHGKKQYVIEFQATPIASKYIERHELYQAAGINDIWILGMEKNKIKLKYRNVYYIPTSKYIYKECAGFLNWKEQKILTRNTGHLSYYEIIEDDYLYSMSISDMKINFNNYDIRLGDNERRLEVEKEYNSFKYLFSSVVNALNSKEKDAFSIDFIPHRSTLARIEYTSKNGRILFQVKKDSIHYDQDFFGEGICFKIAPLVLHNRRNINEVVNYIYSIIEKYEREMARRRHIEECNRKNELYKHMISDNKTINPELLLSCYLHFKSVKGYYVNERYEYIRGKKNILDIEVYDIISCKHIIEDTMDKHLVDKVFKGIYKATIENAVLAIKLIQSEDYTFTCDDKQVI